MVKVEVVFQFEESEADKMINGHIEVNCLEREDANDVERDWAKKVEEVLEVLFEGVLNVNRVLGGTGKMIRIGKKGEEDERS